MYDQNFHNSYDYPSSVSEELGNPSSKSDNIIIDSDDMKNSDELLCGQNFHDYTVLYQNPPSSVANEYGIITIDNDDVKTSDEILIQLVKGYPFLYKKQNVNYKDSLMKENAWSEIGSTLGLSALECSSRWLRLRQYFTKERLKRQKETRTGSGTSKRKKWIFYEQMLFLEDKILQRKTFGNYAQISAPMTKTKPTITRAIEHIEKVPFDVSEEIDYSSDSSKTSLQTLEKEIFNTEIICNKDSSNSSLSPSSLPIEKEYTQAAKSGCLDFQTPKSGYSAGRKRKSNNDPVEDAFLKMNKNFQLAVDKLCFPSTSNITEDEDCLFGKLVAAELRKHSVEKKEAIKRKILLDLYS